jgi:hypothetical protein
VTAPDFFYRLAAGAFLVLMALGLVAVLLERFAKPDPEHAGCSRCHGRGWWEPLSQPGMRIRCDEPRIRVARDEQGRR